MERLDWTEYFLRIAQAVSLRGDCRRRQVGAVLVDSQHKIIGTGYNGIRAGRKGCIDGVCPRGLLSSEEVIEFTEYNNPKLPGFCISTHSEMNAMLHAGRDCLGATMYITCYPCIGCQKAMGNAGIVEYIYRQGETIITLTNGSLLK